MIFFNLECDNCHESINVAVGMSDPKGFHKEAIANLMCDGIKIPTLESLLERDPIRHSSLAATFAFNVTQLYSRRPDLWEAALKVEILDRGLVSRGGADHYYLYLMLKEVIRLPATI